MYLRYEKIDFQIKVREEFMKMKENDNGKLPWITIDAKKSIKEIHEEIIAISEKIIIESGNKSIVKLWS